MYRTSKTLNLSSTQKNDHPASLKHEIITIPASNPFSFGSSGLLNLKEKNIKIHELTIQFNMSALTGAGVYTPNQSVDQQFPTGGSLSPTFWWFNRIDIVISGKTVDTIYPDSNFILNQLYTEDSKRIGINVSAGSYNDIGLNRILSSAPNDWYLPLKTIFNQSHFNLLNQSHEIELRVFMNTLKNIVNIPDGITTEPVCTINSVNLIARITRLPIESAEQTMMQLTKQPRHYLFHETRFQNFTIQPNQLSATCVLTSFVGKINTIYFVVRPFGQSVPNNLQPSSDYFKFKSIKDFALYDSGGANCVGGNFIKSRYNLNIMSKWWNKSSYCSEGNNYMSGYYNTQYDSTNVYQYSFSIDPAEAHDMGTSLSNKTFLGNEQLVVNFHEVSTSNITIDVFGSLESAIEQTKNGVEKIGV